MSVDLSKCKVGDKVELRNGDIRTIIVTENCEAYPVVHDGGNSGFHGVTPEGHSCIKQSEYDIIRVLGKISPKSKRKVAKCEIHDNGCDTYWFRVDDIHIESDIYSSRNNAIIGAKRFCKRIGFECQIVDGGDK